MFEPAAEPRVFGLAPGIDFPRALVEGLRARMAHLPPEAMGRVHLVVNTTRMERRLRELFIAQGPGILPRLHLVTHLDALDPAVALPPAVNPLRRRLELIALVSRLLDSQPELAPRASLYALTDSLAALIDEMQGEGVTAEDIRGLDVSDQSRHWQRSQEFIGIAQNFLRETTTLADKEARQRAMVRSLATHWRTAPPQHPVILAGSTGSRGTTLMLMEAIARLPQGALVLPGYDFDMPAAEWAHLDDPMTAQDHPQYRFHKLLRQVELSPRRVSAWHRVAPPSPARNALVSLSLRPAPVTHAWLTEGPALRDLDAATRHVTLLEAPGPRGEALAIALRLRQAVEDGQKAAVITPDRMLTRQITAALDQWDILPDDSAGSPLHLSPPGRFLRHVAALFHRRLDAESLLTLLKHPLCHSATDRGRHVLNTQRLELQIRADGLPYPDLTGILRLLEPHIGGKAEGEGVRRWATWVGTAFTGQLCDGALPLADWVARHRALAEAIAAGPDGADSGELWRKNAGQEALKVMDNLALQSAHGLPMTGPDYAALAGALLADGEVRDRDAPHPGVMIWGTLEARVQGADLVILAGLNDGTWPEAPDPDPWLNRTLRNQAGLLLPDRRIGLSAHDYQQAVAAPEVWITRAIRSDDAQTVASRWVNRLCNLLGGLKTQQGPELLDAMRARGNLWVQKAQRFEEVTAVPPARRPSPRPPVAARPHRLSVTDIKHLIRDPYAIYAKRVLKLRKLGPLVQTADALSRGRALHEVMEIFVRRTVDDSASLDPAVLVATAEAILDRDVPWPTARALWRARVLRFAEWFVERERQRRRSGRPIAFEEDATGRLDWPDLPFSLVGQADRIDETGDGRIILYDYKTGTVPKEKEQRVFDKQLLLEAAMVEQGAFSAVGKRTVAGAFFIGLGSKPEEVAAPLDDNPTELVLAELRQLIEAYFRPDQGYTARRALKEDRFVNDYDLLARHGEWDISQDPWPEDLE